MYERALIVGASGGIGAALASAVRAKEVLAVSRSADGLDVTSEQSVAAFADSLSGPFDFIFAATGVLMAAGRPVEKRMAEWGADGMAETFAVNALGPALLLKHLSPLLPREGRSVFACLSARVGSIGDNELGGWASYRASKAALNQFVRCAAIELVRSRPEAICVALHPGTVKTEFTKAYWSKHGTVEPGAAASNICRVLDGLGAEDSGGFFDWQGKRVPW